MTQRNLMHVRRFVVACGLFTSLVLPGALSGEPTPAAISLFNAYVGAVEARISQQHRSPESFLAGEPSGHQLEQPSRSKELLIEQITPVTDAGSSGAMLHHWRGTAFLPGGKAADFERLLKDVNAYPQRFQPQVLQAKVLRNEGDHLLASIRVRQKHVITVVMDTTYDIRFGTLDRQHGYSTSRSTRIVEVGWPGLRGDLPLNPSEEHGFLWRLNTYWSYEERAGGLFVQIETISLSRSIPRGLGWALGSYAESVPRESLEFTLRSAAREMHK